MSTSTPVSGDRQGRADATPRRALHPTGIGALTDIDWLRSFSDHLWHHFREDRCFEAAGALSYTTLLALVPLLAVVLGVISAFPVFDLWAEEFQAFIFQHFVPTAGDVVQEHIQGFIEQAGGLTGAGTVFLVAAALLLMGNIEKIFNRIWRVPGSRRTSNRIVMYWSVLTLGPLLVGGSLALSSYLAALSALAPDVARGAFQTLILGATPFFVTLLAFAILFMVVPNRRVLIRHALVGALVSALLFELAQRGFVFYVTNFPTYQRLYGALATLPIFLVWIYLSWVVILLGGSITAALTTFRYRRADWRWSARHEFLLALRLMGHFWHAQRRGESLGSGALLSREPAATDNQLQRILGNLHAAGVVQRDDDGDWFLSADLDELCLRDLYEAAGFVLPLTETRQLPSEHHWDRALIEALEEMNTVAEPLMNRSIKSYLKFDRKDCTP